MPALTLRIMNNTGICRNFLTGVLASVNTDNLGMSESLFVIPVSGVRFKELTFTGIPVIEHLRVNSKLASSGVEVLPTPNMLRLVA